jgi:hypothetical protein
MDIEFQRLQMMMIKQEFDSLIASQKEIAEIRDMRPCRLGGLPGCPRMFHLVGALNGADEKLNEHACRHRLKLWVSFACGKLP